MNATLSPPLRRKAGFVWMIAVGGLLLGGRAAEALAPGARLVGMTLSPPGGALRAHNSLVMQALGSFDDGTSGLNGRGFTSFRSIPAGT